jgi:hypothetical protein
MQGWDRNKLTNCAKDDFAFVLRVPQWYMRHRSSVIYGYSVDDYQMAGVFAVFGPLSFSLNSNYASDFNSK